MPWEKATTQGALLGMAAGLGTWVALESGAAPNPMWPPQLVGFLAAMGGMVVGSLLPQWIFSSSEVARASARPSLGTPVE